MNGNSNNTSNSSKVLYHDLGDRTYSAMTKFELAAFTSIAINVFRLDSNSSIFGIKFKDLNERFLECGFSIFALGLGVNYLLRYLDEGKVFSLLSQNLVSAKEQVEALVEDIQSALAANSHIGSMKTFESSLSQAVETISGYSGANIGPSVKRLDKWAEDRLQEIDDASTGRKTFNLSTAGEEPEMRISEMLDKIEDEIKAVKTGCLTLEGASRTLEYIPPVFTSISKNISEITPKIETLENFLKSIKVEIADKDIRPKYASFRIITFMIVVPIALWFGVIGTLVYAIYS